MTLIAENSVITLKTRVNGEKKSFLITFLTSNKSCREQMLPLLEPKEAKEKAQLQIQWLSKRLSSRFLKKLKITST